MVGTTVTTQNASAKTAMTLNYILFSVVAAPKRHTRCVSITAYMYGAEKWTL